MDETVYIATPEGIIEDKVMHVHRIGNCKVVVCSRSILIVGDTGEVIFNSKFPEAVDIDSDEECNEECEEEAKLIIKMADMTQVGNTDVIGIFQSPEDAEQFHQNAQFFVKLHAACKAHNKNKE